MIPVLIVCGICILTWGFVKQTARTLEKPEWWDLAEPAAACVGAIGFAYTNHPYVWNANNPIWLLAHNSLVFGVSVAIFGLWFGLAAEDGGLIRTPDKLAPLDARFHEQVSSVDELDGDTLAEYVEET